MENFENFTRDGQQRQSLEWVMEKITPLITPNEIVEYIATGGSMVKNLKPDAIVITNNRYILIKSEIQPSFRIKSTFTLVSIDKTSVDSCQVKISNKYIAEVCLFLNSGIISGKINIPLNQAFRVYKLINNKEFEITHGNSTPYLPAQIPIPLKYRKIFAGVLVVVVFVLILKTCLSSGDKPDQKSNKATIEGSSSGKITYDANGNQITQKNTNASTYKIEVSSLIVKKIDEKYRYFFNVKNIGAEGFQGQVKIFLITKSGNDEFDETFENTTPMPLNWAHSVYFDIFNGPPSEYGTEGITKFRYEVYQGDLVIKRGSGGIKW